MRGYRCWILLCEDAALSIFMACKKPVFYLLRYCKWDDVSYQKEVYIFVDSIRWMKKFGKRTFLINFWKDSVTKFFSFPTEDIRNTEWQNIWDLWETVPYYEPIMSRPREQRPLSIYSNK